MKRDEQVINLSIFLGRLKIKARGEAPAPAVAPYLYPCRQQMRSILI